MRLPYPYLFIYTWPNGLMGGQNKNAQDERKQNQNCVGVFVVYYLRPVRQKVELNNELIIFYEC